MQKDNSNLIVKNKILEAFDVMVKALEPWLLSYTGNYNTSDSTYMIYHMFMSYISNTIIFLFLTNK